MQPFGVIVLAAGESSRFGSPKQLAMYEGETLIERAVQTALDSGAEEVVVIVGANKEQVTQKLARFPVRAVENVLWREGMSSSIIDGIEELDMNVAVIMTCDQPLITSDHLHALAAGTAHAPVAASSYDGVLGVPCAFTRETFGELLKLEGDDGARDLIRSRRWAVHAVPFEGGSLDVDEPKDLKAAK